jgi:ribosomal protein S18 acetylase RimI-like enzyme
VDGIMHMGRYRIRDFEAADDAACKALELSGGFVTPKNPIGKALFRGSFTHCGAFDSKARQYPISHVIVCEDSVPQPGEPALVGVVMLGIKRVTLHGTNIMFGYTFDLRVHEKAQRNGIGLQLCKEVEARCRAAGVHTLYLSVNSDNTRAKKLYTKLGWSHACKRAPQMSLLLKALPTGLALDVDVTQLSAEAAAQVLIASHGSRDCALPADAFLQLLTTHPAYETSFMCITTDRASRASVHLWNGSYLGGFHVSRLLVPTMWLAQAPFTAALAAAAAGLFLVCASWIVQQALAGNFLFFSVGVATCTLLLFGVRKVAPLAALLRRMLVNSNYPERRKRMRARLFGLSCEGPRGGALLAGLVQHAKNDALRRGFDMCVVNLAADDPLLLAVGKPSFHTFFMQKRLGNEGEGTSPPPPFDPSAFHDPRDMS